MAKIFSHAIRKNRGEPQLIQSISNADLKVGETVARHNNSVMVLAWRDKKIVKMVSTLHQNHFETVEVWKRGFTGKVQQQKPTCVVDYNCSMNGVDKLDQNIVYYPCVRKSHKWTNKFVLYLFEIALFNSFVIYKRTNPDGACRTLLTFIQSVVKSWTSRMQNEEAERDEEAEREEEAVRAPRAPQ